MDLSPNNDNHMVLQICAVLTQLKNHGETKVIPWSWDINDCAISLKSHDNLFSDYKIALLLYGQSLKEVMKVNLILVYLTSLCDDIIYSCLEATTFMHHYYKI